jgi:predicted RNA-binding Zn-ribbon protein involved in translation (DUF1610 family)
MAARNTRMAEERIRMSRAKHIVAFPSDTPCPDCGAVVQDWHTEWTDPAQAPDFYKGLRALDCPLCGAWVLYREGRIQTVPAGEKPEKTRRLPLQAARWAKSQSNEGNLRDYLDQSPAGKQYAEYFTDQEIQEADADAQADPRY